MNTVSDIIREVIEYLESWNCKPTKENIKRTLWKWIENLYSQVGKDAHEHLLACGIVDKTGISWEEQDIQKIQQIKQYKQCLMEIELYM